MKFLQHGLLFFCAMYVLAACQPDEAADRSLYEAVPTKAVFIVETSDPVQALEDLAATDIYRDIDSLPPIKNFSSRLKVLKQQFKDDSLPQLFAGQPMLLVVSLSGADKYNMLWVTESSRELEQQLVPGFSKSYRVESRTYNEAKILSFKNEQQEFYATSYHNLLIFSNSKNQVEASVRQLNSELNLMNDEHFQKLYETANRKDLANIFINLDELGDLSKNLMPHSDGGYLQRLGNWAELDLQVETNELILSGLISMASTDEAYYLECFHDLKPSEIKAGSIVPAGTGLWLGLSFSNAEQYHRQYLQFLEKSGRLRTHELLLQKLPYPAAEHLLHWVDDEIGLIITSGKNRADNHVAYLKYRSEPSAQQALEIASDSLFVEGYRGMVLRKLEGENALPRLYGPIFSRLHKPYFTLVNGYAIFSESLPVLKGVVNDVLDQKTFADEDDFKSLTRRLTDDPHIRLIATTPGFLGVMGNALAPEDATSLEQHTDQLNNLRWGALEISVEEQAAFTHLYLQHSVKQKEKVQRVWSTQLESEAANEPQFLKNHVNKRYDIAIQDKDHRLYLLDYNGKILWTKMLDGPIMGNIHQVDAYKNNKLQMVFNTPQKLYLVDRLGRDVESFPVSLPQSATAPVGVFNYDNSRNYRLVVPAGNDLLNYDLTGKQVKGWEFKKAESDLITRPQHFSVKGRDVIVAETEDGKLLQLNRRGEVRFEKIEGLPRLHIPFYLKEADKLSTSEMLTIADNGKLYAIHPGGTVDDLYLDEQHPADHFLYFDDKYIFSSDEMLLVKSDENPWSAELKDDISHAPKAMILEGNFYAGAYSADAEEIRVFNAAGELIEGFPVFAQGPFDMGSLKLDGTINIVTYSEDGTLICYRVD